MKREGDGMERVSGGMCFDGLYQPDKTGLSGVALERQLAGIYVAPDSANLV